MLQLDLRRYVILAEDSKGQVTLENYDTEDAYQARMNAVTAPGHDEPDE